MPGQPVTLVWTSTNESYISTCNFSGEDLVNQQNGGTIVDHPVISQTYILGFTPGNAPISQTVTVSPTAQTYIVVGNSQDVSQSVPIEQQALQNITTIPVTVQQTVPTSVTADALILDDTGTISPSDVPSILAYLSAGKGVVFLGLSPRMLATGDATNTDLTAIASWFGASNLENAHGSSEPLPTTKFFPTPVTLQFGSLNNDFGVNSAFASINPAADPVAGVPPPFDGNPNEAWYTAFAFRPAAGGQVFYQSDGSMNLSPLLLEVGARWAAVPSLSLASPSVVKKSATLDRIRSNQEKH
jgi:hypothetical protein